jgi:hypothetical protein
VQHVITVRKPQVDVYVWDDSESDGDRISVFMNEGFVLQNYVLVRTKKKLTLNLVEGANYLAIQADDMGSKPPAVVAVRLMKNDVPKDKHLISDLSQSGALKIIYKP